MRATFGSHSTPRTAPPSWGLREPGGPHTVADSMPDRNLSTSTPQMMTASLCMTRSTPLDTTSTWHWPVLETPGSTRRKDQLLGQMQDLKWQWTDWVGRARGIDCQLKEANVPSRLAQFLPNPLPLLLMRVALNYDEQLDIHITTHADADNGPLILPVPPAPAPAPAPPLPVPARAQEQPHLAGKSEHTSRSSVAPRMDIARAAHGASFPLTMSTGARIAPGKNMSPRSHFRHTHLHHPHATPINDRHCIADGAVPRAPYVLRRQSPAQQRGHVIHCSGTTASPDAQPSTRMTTLTGFITRLILSTKGSFETNTARGGHMSRARDPPHRAQLR
ncbi:hypothetical protein EDB85DRAFT_1897450 [Lactarius pseudohatsudake]|nr:hypothetical protein EDB85DRAFT_1897450 [Lactarius pseudohatsudake]